MRVAAVLSPHAEWPPIVEAARAADRLGLDAIGFWDHYHSARPEWAYVCGWSAYGALAAATERVRLVPMVLNALHYQPGVLAKESSILSHISGGRFELALGAGDWPESFAAWGDPFPAAEARIARLVETIRILRGVWTGEPTSLDGSQFHLDGATCTPAPAVPPRVVVGAGASRATMRATAPLVDELNVYADPELVSAARRIGEESGRALSVSVHLAWDWGNWPAEPAPELERWARLGADRVHVSVGSDDMTRRMEVLAEAAGRVAAMPA
ncbi:MAG TPA: LLM class flavin-dependent oxidoreductase [Candidatus Limnocylindria bacterium]|nr:LLM class flavin-dependent oxidoreductase [Candidatus Limnocylindria bacterium]